MSVKVIVDNSPEGLEIKKALEQEKLQVILYHSFVIRWGNWTDDVYGRIVFNSPQSIKNAIDKENVIMLLMKNHVKCPQLISPDSTINFPILGRKHNHEDGSDIRLIDNVDEYRTCDCDYFLEYLDIVEEYQIHVMDLSVFYIEEKYCETTYVQDEPIVRNRASGWKLRRTDLSCLFPDELKNVEELAIRAVHSLGLDFGIVNMARTADGQYYVLDVDASYRWMTGECKDAYVAQFTETLIKYNSLLFSRQDETIGADVECIIKDINTGTLIFASDFFTKDGSAGLDNRSIEAGGRHFPLLEIRPVYSTNPIEVVDSIQSIMSNISEHIYYNNTGVYAGSMPVLNYWVGGHIHFGTKPNSKLLIALDNFLALPVMMIEKVYSARNRKSKYGELGNFMFKSHGFEYRSLGSWIISPEIARGVLCLAKVIIQEYLNLNEEFLSNFYDITAYYSVNKAHFSSNIKNIINNVSGTATFKLYRPYIEPLFNKIASCEEWNEDEPINESWSMTPNGSIFKSLKKCFIPKKKREQLGIELEETVEIMIGAQKYRLTVYPKDDFSIEKNSYASFSSDVCAETGISEIDGVELWTDSHSTSLRAGPVLGILADLEPNEVGPFGRQSYYFRKLIKLSKYKGMIVFVFTISDIEWDNRRVKGYTFNFNSANWTTLYFPIPDVIYVRNNVINKRDYDECAAKFINNIRKMKTRFINSFECINLLNDRWRTFLLLSSNSSINKYLLRSLKFQKEAQLSECLKRYVNISLKLREASKGECILSVRRTANNNYEILQKYNQVSDILYEDSLCNLIQAINNIVDKAEYLKTDLIIQCEPALIKYNGRDLEISVVMQKNSLGLWFRTCISARYWGENGKFINIVSVSESSYAEAFRVVFDTKADEVVNKIRKASKDIAIFMDSKELQIGEMAIDFVVDKSLNVFVSGINFKPDNLLSSVGAFKIRNLAVNRILEYSRFLVYKETKRV